MRVTLCRCRRDQSQRRKNWMRNDKNAGIIIEEPAFLGNESGRKNLELLYMLRHKRDKKKDCRCYADARIKFRI